MKLLFSLTAYPPSVGGAQLHQHMLAREFTMKHTVQVVTLWNSTRTDWLLGTTIAAPGKPLNYQIDGIPIHRLGFSLSERMRMLPYVAMYYPMMASVLPDLSRIYEKQLESFAQDVDLIHNVRLGREPLSYASLQLARKFRVPFILTPVHHPRWVGWRYKAYLELYQMADAIVAMTNSEKETLTSLGVEPGRIFVSGMGPVLAPSSDPSGFVTKQRLNGPVILFLGQHFPYKGHRQVLEAAAIVWRRFPETHFVFIGPSVGGSEKIYKIYKDVRIHRMHNVNLQEKTDAIASSTMLCVPSMQESFGGVYTEAWSFSKPVIGCRIPAVSEVIDDTVNGLLVRQDPQEIANAICMLLSDEKLSKELGESGKRKVEAQYTWARIAKRTEEAYLAAVRETRPE